MVPGLYANRALLAYPSDKIAAFEDTMPTTRSGRAGMRGHSGHNADNG